MIQELHLRFKNYKEMREFIIHSNIKFKLKEISKRAYYENERY